MFFDPTGLDVYYFVTSEFKKEFYNAEKMLQAKFNEPVHLIITDNEKQFLDGWNAMGTEDGKKVNISAVIINGHSDGKDLQNVDVNKLKGKTIDTVLLLNCNAGHLDHIYDSPMAKIIHNNNTGSVIAADGSVHFKNKGWFKDTKRTEYSIAKSRNEDQAFVDLLLDPEKEIYRNPVGFIKYTLYEGVLYEDWLGRDFVNVNAIFNKAGIYDRPSRNP